jgi:hypothetical protein
MDEQVYLLGERMRNKYVRTYAMKICPQCVNKVARAARKKEYPR